MKKSRFTEEQIIRLFKEAEAGKPIAQICPEQGVADVTFYRWREKYGGKVRAKPDRALNVAPV